MLATIQEVSREMATTEKMVEVNSEAEPLENPTGIKPAQVINSPVKRG